MPANDNHDTEHVTEEDTLLLEWAEFAMENLAGMPPRGVPLMIRSLKLLADKYPELVEVRVVDADAIESALCNDPACEGCNAVRSALGQMQATTGGVGKANLH